MCHLKSIFLFVFIIGCIFQAHGADKYTDENRPYEFGFTIDGQQHRHEKKDKNGIIMGEFGFITADGVYHVTVYATDEQGRFKILSMKNIRVKPYPTSPSVNGRTTTLTTQERNPKALAISNTSINKGQSTAYSNSPQSPLKESRNTEQPIKQINNAGPAKSCSHCSVPTTTTLAPKLPPSVPTNNNNQFQQNNYGNSQQYPGQNDLPLGTVSKQQQGQNNNANQEIYREQYSPRTINQLQQKTEDSGLAYNREQGFQPGSNSYNQKSNIGQNYYRNSEFDSSNAQAPAAGGYQQNSGVNPNEPQVPITGGNVEQNSGVTLNDQQVPITGENYEQNSGVNPNSPQVPITGGNVEQNPGVGIENTRGSFIGGNYQSISGSEISNPELPTLGGNYPQNYDAGLSKSVLSKPSNEGNYQQNSGLGLNNPGLPNAGGNYPQNYNAGLSNSVPSKPSNEGNYQQNSGLGINNPALPTAGGNYPQNYDAGVSNSVSSLSSNGGNNQQNSYSGLINQQNVNGPPQIFSEQNRPQTNINGGRNPKSFRDILKSAIPDQQFFNSGASSPLQGSSQSGISQPTKKPVLIAAQMQLVDKDTNIYQKNPGESDGLPKGLNKDDMSHLLYTFNYTVGFHGHHEEGYTNGVKQGYYYVVGRNGVRTRVDYVADEKGFHPRISQETLDISSDDVPKPETEKDDKYGLKGYEFKWLYYPVDSRKR